MSYELPEGLVTKSVTYSYERLLLGGLMLLDEEHPLPDGAPAPNTMSVATYGKGMVPVNGLSVKSGRDTIQALAELFASLRSEGVSQSVRMERYTDTDGAGRLAGPGSAPVCSPNVSGGCGAKDAGAGYARIRR